MPEPTETTILVGANTGSDPALSFNLEQVSDFSTQQAFLDVFKTAREWIGHLPDQFGGVTYEELLANSVFDENGWPTFIPEELNYIGTLILTAQHEDDQFVTGRYVLRYEGEGTVEINLNATVISQAPGEIIFEFNEPGPNTLVEIQIRSTDPNGTGDYIRNISVVKEEYVDLYDSGAIFNPAWVDFVDDVRLVRFMDWMRTNNSEQSEWEDRPMVDDFSWGTEAGVPLEIMVRLANELGADAWFNIPHLATDEYITEFATIVRDTLDSRLKAHFEFSNEVWNFTFDQTDWAHEMGQARWGEDVGDAFLQFYGISAANMARILDDVYGDLADAQLVKVIGVQTAVPGREEAILNAPNFLAEDANNQSPVEFFDAYAVTGYFGFDLGGSEVFDDLKNDEDGGFARAMELVLVSVDETIEDFQYHVAAADDFGLSIIMYEGGSHIVANGSDRDNEEFVSFLDSLNRSAGIQDAYQRLLEGWVNAGGTSFNKFNDIRRNTESGPWGTIEFLGDTNGVLETLLDYNATADTSWELRQEGTFDDGVIILGGIQGEDHEGTLEEDFIAAGGGDDTVTGGGAKDGLHGGSGNDLLNGGAGGDTIDGGDGIDTASYESSSSAVTVNLNTGVFARGDAAGDTLTSIENLTGSVFADRLVGDAVANALKGGAGSDTLAGGGGVDTVEGGAGNDVIFAGVGDESSDLFAGGDGNDLIAAGAGDDLAVGDSAVASGLTDTSTTADGSDTLFGGSGDDTLIAGGWEDTNGNNRYDDGEQRQSGSSSNVAYSGPGNDVLHGDGGNDVLGGGDGEDVINGAAGNDIFYGGKDAGADTLFGGVGNDTLFAGSGNDALDGGVDADKLFGGAGDDTLGGGSGADSLFGGGGDDQITGGSGGDFFFFGGNHGDDVVTDFNAGEDKLFLANAVTDFTDLASVVAAATEITVGGTSGLLIDTGGGNSLFLEGMASDDLIEGSVSL